jgi:hypothetical protein
VAARPHRRAPAAQLAARRFQLDGVDKLAAAIALIAPSVLEAGKNVLLAHFFILTRVTVILTT